MGDGGIHIQSDPGSRDSGARFKECSRAITGRDARCGVRARVRVRVRKAGGQAQLLCLSCDGGIRVVGIGLGLGLGVGLGSLDIIIYAADWSQLQRWDPYLVERIIRRRGGESTGSSAL